MELQALAWRAGPIAPERIDKPGQLGRDACAPPGERRLEARHLGDRMKPRVEPHARPLTEPFGQPIPWPRSRRLDDLIGGGVNLLGRLGGIAAINEKRRLIAEYDGKARRACKARQPGEPFGARGDVFALVLVGTRHQIGVEPVRSHELAERGESARFLATTRCRSLERLKHGSPFPGAEPALSIGSVCDYRLSIVDYRFAGIGTVDLPANGHANANAASADRKASGERSCLEAPPMRVTCRHKTHARGHRQGRARALCACAVRPAQA